MWYGVAVVVGIVAGALADRFLAKAAVAEAQRAVAFEQKLRAQAENTVKQLRADFAAAIAPKK